MAMKKKSGNNEAGISHAVVKFKGLKIPQLVPIKIVMENARKVCVKFWIYYHSKFLLKLKICTICKGLNTSFVVRLAIS